MRRIFLALLYLFITITLSASEIKVSGYVRDNHGKPVSGVKVTDGFDIVRTDASGRYVLNACGEANFVYISVPSGFETTQRNGAPLFYKQLDKSNKTQKADFEIIRTGKDETHHQFVVFADVQVYNESEIDYVYKAAADVKTDIASNGLPTFGMSCGDIVGTWSSGLSERIQTATSSAGFPFYTLMGNHDYQSGVGTNEESKIAYTSKYGPTYYSFDKGQMHYIVLDDVFYFYRHYIGYLEETQLEWLEKDLLDVPDGSTVVLFLHIPTYSKQAREGQWNKEEYNKIVTNRNALYKIMEPYKLHICSAHEHYAENYVIKDNIFEHVHAPLSGLFWQSLYSCDGVPWGYYVYDVNGNEITDWYYKPVGKSRDCQFSAYRVGEDPMKRTSVVANVWNYDPAWKVEWRENGVDQGPMTQYSGWDRNIVDDVDNRREKEFTWKYIGAGQTDHLFYATPFNADSDIEIVVTDRFGRVYTWNSSRDDIYSTTSFTLNSEGVSEGGNEYPITQSSAYSKYGSFHGADKLETNLYNLAISEMVKNMEADGTFRTGQLWSGVWTRDISYSAILSLAHLEPEAVKTSLMRKVDRKGRIIEDTGTGGSWPCSTDREIWAIAAYEVYLETGDVSWLRQVYPIIRRSLDADLASVYDKETGLFRGESSFIDWREQSYPSWMQPVDIAASECLGTNAVFYRALEVASLMASKLGPTRSHDVKKYAALAANLKKAINDNFWMEDKGYYAQFLYGRDYQYASPRSETLGESLCILWNIASSEQSQRIMESLRVCDYGPTIFSPQITGERSYHNNAVWPFVTSFYGMAAAKAGNRAAVMHALASNMRTAVVFESNMENMVASDGTKNTALNSPRQLWSVAGFEGLFRNVLLGINYTEDGIRLQPCVPVSMKGYRALENFKYRNMTLDVEVVGEGNIVSSCLIDGVEQQMAFLPASLEGHHKIQLIVKSDYYAPNDSINLGPLVWDLNTPKVEFSQDDELLKWTTINGASYYRVYKNGSFDGQVEDVSYKTTGRGEYVVVAYNDGGSYSFMSEPIRVGVEPVVEYNLQKRLNNKLGVQMRWEVEVASSGEYMIEFEYSNGNGDITTHNMCASRSLFVDKNMYDVVVMPQRGTDWTLKGMTRPVHVNLTAGKHIVELKYLEDNVNMNIETDSAVIHSLRIIRVDY